MGKTQLLIYLEKVELPDGLKMRLNRIQAIYWYRYEEKERALERLYSAPGLSLCRAEETASPVPSKVPANEAVSGETGAEEAGQASLEAPGPRSEKPHGGRRGIILGALAGVLVIAVVLAAVLGGRGNPQGGVQTRDSGEEASRAVETAAPTAAPVSQENPAAEALSPAPDTQAVPANSRHIVLRANEKMTVREFTEATELLKARLDIFAGEDPYQMTLDGDTVDLFLPDGRFADGGLEYTLRCYLSRATELYALQVFTDRLEQENDWVGTFGIVPVSREELERVTVQYGAVSGADPETLAKLGIEGDSYTYVALVLTSECAQRLEEASEAWENGFCFSQDMGNSPWYSFYTVPGNDNRTFYLINSDQTPYFSELLAFNLTHPALPYHFQYSLDLNETTEWERVEEASGQAGRNQCNAEDLTGQTVTFVLKCYEDKYTAGEWYDLNAALKDRLDALEIPYAFSLNISDGYTYATVRCPLRHMGIPIIASIGETSFTLQAGLTERSLYQAALVHRTGPGASSLELEGTGSDVSKLTEVSQAAMDDGDGVIYLKLGKTRVLQTMVDAVIEDGTIAFDRLCFNGNAKVTEETDWLLGFLDIVRNGNPLRKSFRFASLQYNPDEAGKLPGAANFEIVHQNELHILESIQAVCPDGKVYTGNDLGTIYVLLHLEINDQLPEKSIEIAERIYNAFDFASSSFDAVTLYLVDEDNLTMERARLFFDKSYNSYSSDTSEGYVYARGIFCGGRLEPYKDLMRSAVENSAFLKGLYHPDKSDWTWELS